MTTITVSDFKLILAHYTPRLTTDDSYPRAAVLVPVYLRDGEPYILFTKRSEYVNRHKGEISFPGGAFTLDDGDLVTTALRETCEEIGVQPNHIEVIGQLDDLTTISDFRVTPYVGAIARSPYPFVASPFEVETILEVPLSHLLDRANIVWTRRIRRGREIEMPGYAFGEHIIWGATASILRQLLDLIETYQAYSKPATWK